MGFLNRLMGRETRSTVPTSDPYLAEFFGQNGSGLAHVDPARASGLAVAHRCVTLVAELMASVPLFVYRQGERGSRDRASDHPAYSVLHDSPNGQMTAFEFREAMIANVLVHGNAYAEVERDGRGQVIGLHLIDPRAVAVERLRTSGRLRYTVTGAPGRVLLQGEVLHVRYRLAPNGIMGLSPIQIARETFGLALSQQDAAAKQAAKGFRPEGAVVFAQSINPSQKVDVLDKLRQKIERNDSTSGILVLDGGADWKPFAFSSKDSEFLESRKLTALDVCRVFGVPPSAAGITDNATYSNIGEESRALVQRCLAPMAKRIEQAMNMALLTPEARRTFFIEHDLAGLLRGDLGARYAAYRIGRDGGWLSPNEIRKLENMPEIDGGDEYLSPLNMTALGKEGTEE
ncbi:MAG: phage portal protein [Rhodobacteraceae bacterium GWE1_64_9]|nr:MAG: phage portal protein [Rhodobacteraceae bacterium GWE1_64_9]OHC48181.1 MAG: phage portal protein [Rhodobacteraceae bacterium GWF1_65_7]